MLRIGNHGLEIRGKSPDGTYTYIIDFELFYKETASGETKSKEKKFTVAAKNEEKRAAQAEAYCKLLRTAYKHLDKIDQEKSLEF